MSTNNNYNGPYITLNNGRKQPQIGFGAWKVPKETAAETIYNAIKEGYRLIDGAQDYANEKEVGDGVRKAISDGIVTREELFITTKVWNTFHDPIHAVESIKNSLKDWGLEYFDLVLIHFPIALKYVDPSVRYPPGFFIDDAFTKVELASVPLSKTWGALEELHEKGLAKSIGVSNYTVPLINELLSYANIKPAVLQIEHHPYLTQPRLIEFTQRNEIAITAYSSFGPQSFVELGIEFAKNTPKLFENEVIRKIAKNYNKSPAQVILRWTTQRGIAVIPKSNNLQRLKENLKSFDFDLSKDELNAISGLNQNIRFNDPAVYTSPPIPIFD